MRKVLVVGDVHGEWGYLNTLINKRKPDIILQCGDFGLLPSISQSNLKQIKSHHTKIYFCDGNHENHDDLRYLTKKYGCIPIKIADNIFYMPRMSTLTIANRKILFAGGAYSIDKGRRTPGYDWYPGEIFTLSEYESLSQRVGKVDMVISHTCPTEMLDRALSVAGKHNIKNEIGGKADDETCHTLSHILKNHQPLYWFFGHWHMYIRGVVGECEFLGLNPSEWTYGWADISGII